VATLAPGGGLFVHRARLFPLPMLHHACPPPCLDSARVRRRVRVRHTIVTVTNRCIFALNRLYSSTSFVHTHPPSHPFPSQPDIPPTEPAAALGSGAAHMYMHMHMTPASSTPSAAQLRMLTALRQRCATFVITARTWRSHSGSACDMVSEETVQHMLYTGWDHAAHAAAAHSRVPTHTHTSTTVSPARDAMGSTPLSFAPSTPTFSSSAAAVVPLVAQRVALPDALHIVPLSTVLPAHVAAAYTAAAASSLMRPPLDKFVLDRAAPLKPPRIAGARAEYVQLVRRMHAVGMLSFTAAPRVVNGVFAVAKDADSDRLIIDAQPANRMFVDSPHVALPNPSHLVQLQLPPSESICMYTAKSDLSNYYHHLGLPPWMQPFFALPPLTPAELAACGLPPDAAFPMCVTLPMGFSHAVYLAQTAHEHVVYSSGALSRDDSVLSLASPAVTAHACTHGIVIDDLFLFSLSQRLADRAMDRVLDAYRAVGFVVKQSKVVRPTLTPVKCIGFDIDGVTGSISLPGDSQRSLMHSTLALLQLPFVTAAQLAHIVGRWTWVMMLRRPSLAVLQHAYRYVCTARGRCFRLWPSVRRELLMLLALLPLLFAHLRQPMFHRVLASDASELAAGVVATPLTPDLHARLWPLCSTRHFAALQTQINSDATRLALSQGHVPSHLQHAGDADALQSGMRTFQRLYDTVTSCRWSTLVSKAWRADEHINVLELRAALLAVHWALSFPSALCSRVYLLLDSTVALFSLWKGRSSSGPLLLVLRRMSALLLAGGVSLLCGWLPSQVNPADAPSRLLTHTSA
jgi:hypothetical protein